MLRHARYDVPRLLDSLCSRLCCNTQWAVVGPRFYSGMLLSRCSSSSLVCVPVTKLKGRLSMFRRAVFCIVCRLLIAMLLMSGLIIEQYSTTDRISVMYICYLVVVIISMTCERAVLLDWVCLGPFPSCFQRVHWNSASSTLLICWFLIIRAKSSGLWCSLLMTR